MLYKLGRRTEQLTKDALTPIRNQQPSQYRQQQQPPTISCSAASSPHSSPQSININKPAACTPAKRDLTEQQRSSDYACTPCHAVMSTTRQLRTPKGGLSRLAATCCTNFYQLLSAACCENCCTARRNQDFLKPGCMPSVMAKLSCWLFAGTWLSDRCYFVNGRKHPNLVRKK